jgi:hypothetical protein
MGPCVLSCEMRPGRRWVGSPGSMDAGPKGYAFTASPSDPIHSVRRVVSCVVRWPLILLLLQRGTLAPSIFILLCMR